jgi:hypothetical protein
MENGILEVTTGAAITEDSPPPQPCPHFVTMATQSVSPRSLSLKKQKELLLLQLENDCVKLEHDRVKYEKELEFKQDLERAKIKLQQE